MRMTLLVALSLSGVPALVARLRRPAAVVRYDRVREPRARTHLAALGRELVRAVPPAPALTPLEWDWGETRTASASTGAQTAFFRER